jgi:hypothetical protein
MITACPRDVRSFIDADARGISFQLRQCHHRWLLTFGVYVDPHG